jgi:hypothetical protein
MSEKIVLSILMSMGLLASGAAIAKLVFSTRTNTYDISWTLSDAILCCWLEITLGIIAACIPCLKGLSENQMRRFGLLQSERRSNNYVSDLSNGDGWGPSRDKSLDMRKNGEIKEIIDTTESTKSLHGNKSTTNHRDRNGRIGEA